MQIVFRWYGESDPVTIEKIAQVPCIRGVVSAVYSRPPGEVWDDNDIIAVKTQADSAGLGFEVVESVPVHEDIKLGSGKRDLYIANYIENIKRLAKAGVKVICYNFMPVFDWLRTDLAYKLPDNSTTLYYDHDKLLSLNPKIGGLSLPGWDQSYDEKQIAELLSSYENIDKETLWKNFEYFLDAIIPVCEQVNIKMAIHPDDPPWNIFGLPRIITGSDSYERMKKMNPSNCNGITLCTGSLGADPNNDLCDIIKRYVDMIHFVHARNIQLVDNNGFYETAHLSGCGSLDMAKIIRTLHKNDFDGYIRPDHGRMIWGETGKPGYGLYDRALGAMYLYGLWEAIENLL